MKATRSTLQFGSTNLEVLAISNLVHGLTQSEISRAVNKDESSVRYFLKLQGVEPERIAVEGLNVKVKIVPPVIAFSYWLEEAKKGNKSARELINSIGGSAVAPFEKFAGTYLVFEPEKQKIKWKRRVQKNSEAWYGRRLQKALGGKLEVPTPIGFIDLLTSTEIIEIKEIKGWKGALGQVLVYSSYYPSHKKRVHLFGSVSESFLDIIRGHCEQFGVSMTWEP